MHRRALKAALPASDQHLLDFDQEHAMFVGQGTKAGLFQSIMMKPPNISPVYPLISESNTTVINAGSRPLIVFNPELQDRSSLMPANGMTNYYKLLKTIASTDVDLAILATPKSIDRINRSLKAI